MGEDNPNSWPDFEYDFDAAFADVGKLTDAFRHRAQNRILETLGLGEAATESLQILTSGKEIEIVFSQQIAEKLRNGELALPIDKRTGLYRVDARDSRYRIQELGKVRTTTPVLRSAINTITSAAHLVSAIDVQAQLQEINQKIDRLLTFSYADRLGRLRGAYNELIQLLHSSSPMRNEELRRLNSRLNDLGGRFFQTASTTLGQIRDPDETRYWEALTTSQTTAEKHLKEALQNTRGDLRAAEFCWFLQALILSELNQAEELVTHQRIVRQQLERIGPPLIERIGYWNYEVRDMVDERLKRQIAGLRERTVDDIVLIPRGDQTDG